QVAASELDQLVAALAARERSPPLCLAGGIALGERADVVDDHEVALGGRPVGRLQPREALAHLLDLLLDLLLAGLGLAATDLEASVLAELGARQNPDLD